MKVGVTKSFRRRKDSNTWHWRRECSKYPAEPYYLEVKAAKLPTSGGLACPDCTKMDRPKR